MKAKVAIERCLEYDSSLVQSAVANAIAAAGGLEDIIHPGDHVLLKVNLLNDSHPDRAVVTHPEVVRALIRQVKALGGEPIVGEAPGLNWAAMAKKVFQTSGILQVCEEEGARPAPFTDRGYETVIIPENRQMQTLHVAREVLDADVVISVAKAKSHIQALYTGAIKNFFGVIPQNDRKIAHALPGILPFSECLVDIFSAAKHHFSVMDGVIGMEGRGPSSGNPKRLGLILASADPVALDRVTCACMGYDFEVPHLRLAAERGFGIDEIQDIEIAGPAIETVMEEFLPPPTRPMPMQGAINKLAMRAWKLQPKITDDCISCGECIKICPVDAITLGDSKAVIDYEKCVSCFCCHELCPIHAVGEKKSFAVRSLQAVRSLKKRLGGS